MPIPTPSIDQLQALADEFGFSLDQRQARDVIQDMAKVLNRVYAPLDGMPDNLPPVQYARTPGYMPDASEDPLHIWYRKTDIVGASSGPLLGRKVAVKDNVCVAGVAMMNGSSTLEGYVPDLDATVVQRLLDAGAHIAGKTHCEFFCASAGSHTNATGATRNPHREDCTSGGSSSGSAVAVAAGEVDFAVGGDQGGSIRIPASFCGVVGMKPTYGLVPYSGVMPVEMTLDHAGPITANVYDNALMLENIAGPDGLDPRQMQSPACSYTTDLEKGVNGLRIGVLKEGFGWPRSQQDVDETVNTAAERFAALGADVEHVSVPQHLMALQVWLPILLEGMNALLLRGNAAGNNWKGLYPTTLLDAQAGWRLRANQFPPGLKTFVMLGEHVRRSSHGHHYAKAQNVSRVLKAAYDQALEKVDLLLLPTVPMVAPPLPDPDSAGNQGNEPGLEAVVNTAAFNCTGHPAMSLPCGMSDELPVGMSLVGRHFDEALIYRAGHAYEHEFNWRKEGE